MRFDAEKHGDHWYVVDNHQPGEPALCKALGLDDDTRRAHAYAIAQSLNNTLQLSDAIQSQIKEGRLPGDGADQTAERNGLIKALNMLQAVFSINCRG